MLPFVVLHFFICFSLFPPSIGSPSMDDDNALLAFVKGADEFDQFCAKKELTNKQSKEMLAQTYGTHLGILYFLRQNWQCAEMKKEMIGPNDNRNECRCLHNVYKYLYEGQSVFQLIIYLGKPMTFIEVIRALFHNWMFYFRPELLTTNGQQKYNLSLSTYFGQILSKFHGKKNRKEFDEKMEKMFKKMEERAKEAKNAEKLTMMANASASSTSASSSSNDSFFLGNLLDLTPIYYISEALRDEAFLRLVETDDLRSEIDRKRLGMLYLMKKHWHCANALQNQFFNQNQCERFRQYLDILHEYLFRVRYGFAKGRPKPIFQLRDNIRCLSDTVSDLDQIALYYFHEPSNSIRRMDLWTFFSSLKLLNEEEVDYLKKKENAQISYEKAVVDLANGPSNEPKISKETFNDLLLPPLDQERHEFDAKLMALSKKSFSWVSAGKEEDSDEDDDGEDENNHEDNDDNHENDEDNHEDDSDDGDD